MTKEEWLALKPGDRIQGVSGAVCVVRSLVEINHTNDRITYLATNPQGGLEHVWSYEWWRKVEPETPARLERKQEAWLNVTGLNDDEVDILETIAQRMLKLGRKSYGPLDIATDKRDFGQERREEIFDALVYSAVLDAKARK